MSSVVAVQARILSVGQAQYDEGDGQRFELMSASEVLQYAREEAEDLIAYGVMLRIKCVQLEEALNIMFAGYEKNRAAKHATSTTANHNLPA